MASTSSSSSAPPNPHGLIEIVKNLRERVRQLEEMLKKAHDPTLITLLKNLENCVHKEDENPHARDIYRLLFFMSH